MGWITNHVKPRLTDEPPNRKTYQIYASPHMSNPHLGTAERAITVCISLYPISIYAGTKCLADR